MKPVLIAYSPYIKVFGGGEKYFFSVLDVLQKYFRIKLLNQHPEIDIKSQIRDRFHAELSCVEVVPLMNEVDFRSEIPSDAIFFQVANTVPRVVECRKHILHQQIILPRLDQATARKYYPQYNENVLNEDADKRFSFQDHIFFPSNYVRDGMLVNWPKIKSKTSVVYPPVGELFMGANHTGGRKIISVGRFTPLKKQREQIELFRTLSKDLPDGVRLAIIGSSRNQLMDQLKIYAQKLPIEIKYGLNQAELKKEYESSAIFWSTTGLGNDSPDEMRIVEAFGLAIAESMAIGCVPIAINGGGVSEMIDSGYSGYLVSSMEEMGEVTKSLLANQNRLISMSARAQESAKEYSSEIFRRNILEIFLDG